MQIPKVCAGMFLAGGMIVLGLGCAKDKPAEAATTMAATEPASTLPATVPAVPATAPTAESPPAPATVPVAVAPPKSPFMPTHVLTKDEPYYKEIPAAATAPADGMLKAGTKVLVFIPSVTYTKVTTEDGLAVYVAFDGIDPISNK